MSELRKAAQMALEALEEATGYTSCTTWSPSVTDECASVAAELRAALAQQDRASHRTVTYACPVCAASLERQE